MDNFLNNLDNSMPIDKLKLSEKERRDNVGYCYLKDKDTGEYNVMIMNKDVELLREAMKGLHEAVDKYPYTGVMIEIHRLVKELDVWVRTSLKVGRDS